MKLLINLKSATFFAICGILLFSCAKKSDVENLQQQINDLKSNQIASINSQISVCPFILLNPLNKTYHDETISFCHCITCF